MASARTFVFMALIVVAVVWHKYEYVRIYTPEYCGWCAQLPLHIVPLRIDAYRRMGIRVCIYVSSAAVW
jgi:hypothetical protein